MMSVFFHLEIITARALAFSIASLVTLVIVGVAYAAPSGWTCLRGISSTGSTGSGSAKLLF